MTTTITYRKTGKGEWVAFGPAAAMPDLRYTSLISVTRKDGGTDRWYVTRLGREFDADGRKCCYAYLDQKAGKLSSFSADGHRIEDAAAPAKCRNCRCHAETNAGQPGTTLYDGCDRCGCQHA